MCKLHNNLKFTLQNGFSKLLTKKYVPYIFLKLNDIKIENDIILTNYK